MKITRVRLGSIVLGGIEPALLDGEFSSVRGKILQP